MTHCESTTDPEGVADVFEFAGTTLEPANLSLYEPTDGLLVFVR